MSEKLALSRYMNNRNRLGLGWGFGLGLFTIGYLYFGCSYIEKASKSWKEVKFEQCLYLRVPLCYEQNRCAERTLHHLEVSKYIPRISVGNSFDRMLTFPRIF